MGMFDTFHIQHQGRLLKVQTKQFANVLNDYNPGDFVDFEHATPKGVTAWIEDHKQDWRDPACPLEWVVLLLVDGCFLDAYVTESQADARLAAETMVKLWQEPERQAEAFRRHAQAHYEARTHQQHALDQLGALLRDYADWEKRKAEGKDPKPRLAFLWHDFDTEGWDWAVARLLLGLEEYKGRVPARYAVADEMVKRDGLREAGEAD